MGFKCGIVGLPNVGKSTLFNALTKTAAAQAANYPFCTIEPNTGEVAVPDPRMEQLAQIAKSKELIPTRISFVDIAGLVRGASKGEGLGNQFLANIREVDAIVHVLRCFEDSDITHVEGRINPVADAETIETELMLSDLESLERRTEQTRKRATGKDKESMAMLPLMEASLKLLNEGKPVRTLLSKLDDEELRILKSLNLLTSHPVLYVCNVAEADAVAGNEHTAAVAAMAKEQNSEVVIISAAIEAEVAQLPADEAMEFLSELGLKEAGLDQLIRAGYKLLHLITYFTVGPKETRAWTIEEGTKAPQAAGVIHSDFERGFIRAQTIAYSDYIAFKGEVGAKENGKMRSEGKEYVVQDGDVLNFLFNA
ncbi:redox-regulated ATPase YchF [Agrobacterium sp. SHOUNA12C]|uniref:Ribosome-binding ATPase YchF n=2 Tax=Rhizobium rhizogenes TaxID=359 RepID=B9J798_RHIR8|nr:MULTISPECIES: redox-regulated ATPase YchF [Rhizobium]ACM27205.1 GTP-binding protein [Rhizobium rhizogenes K84]KAA6490207.1 redox-regulated ATPase YchF [Agrobacterium sp. ICMP 7243]MCJ9719655.1 redox-regulated ATPase YchF [Agrobacterium sp. BETTINA12B]MCJ9755410.1 redox-regulated ATPase YchF [Agrobacterium sp. SHOUNA12C]OCJ05540.1 redox-regulated ATPase YchF [Agrobacterium sp. 13-626]OCJ14705.1 redox-regulated ATPase YchF [Agrobacterium sp. B133/95]OCJ26247.1 redox-regulated ATPase YchF [A